MTKLFSYFFIATIFLSLTFEARAEEKTVKPNIVVFLVDDLGVMDEKKLSRWQSMPPRKQWKDSSVTAPLVSE